MRVQVLVTVELEPCEPNDSNGPAGEFQASAVEAIRHAVRYGEMEGFVHELSDVVSIELVNIELYEVNEG